MDLKQIFEREEEFQYMLLDRMRSDCNYYLGAGGGHPKHLWGVTEKNHIGYMKAIWEHFADDKKPEWLTMEQILDYERKMVDMIREKPFMERTGAQQEFVYSFWLDHAMDLDLDCSLETFFGMNLEQYISWRDGTLKLNDGSYHEMKVNVYRLPDEVVDKIRKEIVRPSFSSELAFSNSVNQMLPKDKHCFVSICGGAKLAYVYDGDDDVLAVVSPNEILYKENFAQLLKEAGLEVAEANFDKVWRPIRSGSLPKDSLEQSVIATIQCEFTSLNSKIKSAEASKNNSEPCENNRFSFDRS